MTKKQRHQFYKKLLKLVCIDPAVDFGLCHYCRLLGINVYCNMDKLLPELYSFKPKHTHSDYWFSRNAKGWEKRIEIIQKCIEMTA